MTYLGTLFDINYLKRGLALIESLKKHYNGCFYLFILCLDHETYNYFKLRKKSFQQLILIDDVESFYPELLIAKGNRTLVEYYFTLSPVFPLYILETYNISQITTMDADIFFFSNPEKLFEEIERHSVSITPHNFSNDLVYKEIYGKYNVSFQSFKNNSEGIDCLKRWKEQCLEWCFDILEENRFADQKYLNGWPDLYKDLFEINITGAGLAPWNLDKHLDENLGGKDKFNNTILFYHFHQLRFVGIKIVDLGLKDYMTKVNKIVLNKIYRPYVKKVLKNKNQQDNKVMRYGITLISAKQAFNTENAFFYYWLGFLIETRKIRLILQPIKKILKFFRLKTIIKRLINSLGYVISRNPVEPVEKQVPQQVVPRSSMQKTIEWLSSNNIYIKTVLDVGASDGRWSKNCMNYYKDAHYVLFEPQTNHYEALDSMKGLNSGEVTIVKKAVGLKSGKTYFDITDPFGGSLADSKSDNTTEVIVTSLDDCIIENELEGPFLIKLDTHGFEIPILEGALNVLKNCNVLIIEAYNYNIEAESVLFWQLCEYLNNRGFRPIDIVDIMYREYDNSLWQMDIVFIKSSWKGFDYISYK